MTETSDELEHQMHEDNAMTTDAIATRAIEALREREAERDRLYDALTAYHEAFAANPTEFDEDEVYEAIEQAQGALREVEQDGDDDG